MSLDKDKENSPSLLEMILEQTVSRQEESLPLLCEHCFFVQRNTSVNLKQDLKPGFRRR